MTDRVAAALGRAARYRRSLVPPEWQDKPNLTELVTTQLMHPARGLGNGWWHVGNVLDSFSERQPILAVWWHPETDAVKVGRPPKPTPLPEPKPWQPVDNPGLR